MKFLGLTVCLISAFAFLGEAQAQRVELLFDEDQLLQSGRKALKAGYYDRALFYYEEALTRHDFSHRQKIHLHNDLCLVYMYVDRFEEAIVQCETALDLQSNRWQTFNNLGLVYLVMGDYENAIVIFEKGLKLKSRSEILQSNLALAKKRREEDAGGNG